MAVRVPERSLVMLSAAVALWASTPPSMAAQEVGPTFAQVDRIVAIVGDAPITLTELEEQMQVYLQTDEAYPRDPVSLDRLRRDMLNRLIEDQVWVQAAEGDTAIAITEELVQGAVDDRMREVRDGYASELDFERSIRSAGFATQAEYRRWLGEQTRAQLLREALQQRLRQMGELRPIPPTERELREYYEEAKRTRLPERPPTVGFRQIIITPRPDSSALRAALVRAESLLVRIRKGEDFGELARQYSDDPGSADQGGQIGWIRRGQGYAREFEEAVFRLDAGETSDLVLTSFGFHIIQVLRTEPGHAQVRHILIAPKLTEADHAEARAVADSVAAALRRGASFDSIQRLRHDQDEQSLVSRAVRERLPAEYQEALAEAKPGDIVGPVRLPRPTGDKWAVIRFLEALDADEFTFEELRDRLREDLAQRNGVERYLETLKKNTYIEIRL